MVSTVDDLAQSVSRRIDFMPVEKPLSLSAFPLGSRSRETGNKSDIGCFELGNWSENFPVRDKEPLWLTISEVISTVPFGKNGRIPRKEAVILLAGIRYGCHGLWVAGSIRVRGFTTH